MLPVSHAEQLVQVLAPLVEAAVVPLRAELADVRALLSTRDQELGAALERIRALEAPREPTPAENASGGPTDASTIEPSQAPTRPERPWWLRWLPT